MFFEGIVLLGLIIFFAYSRRPKGLHIPGPWGLPLIGNLHQLGDHPHLMLSKWAKDYGPIYQVQVANFKAFVINDPALAKAFFSQEEFLGRVNKVLFEKYETGTHGIGNLEGEHWKVLQKFTIKHLRELGLGSNKMERLILSEVEEVLEWLKSNKGNPVKDIRRTFEFAVLNALWTITNGRRMNRDNSEMTDIIDRTGRLYREMAQRGPGILFLAPWLRHIFPDWTGYRKLKKVWASTLYFFNDAVAQHKATYANDRQRDLIDAFLKEIKDTRDPNSVFYGEYGERQLVATVIDLFTAGSGTTTSSLSWTILYLCTFPGVQIKLQEEILNVTGNSRVCTLSDRPRMPYAEAVVAEVLRQATIIPFGMPHLATRSKVVKGYHVPKHSIVVVNSHCIHHNPAIWGDPDTFRPERFLSADGSTFVKNDALMPFSTGRRKCIGESLAKDTLFLFMTNIFQTFNVRLDPSESHPGFLPLPNFVMEPKPFSILLEERT